jgi:tellurite resistance protein
MELSREERNLYRAVAELAYILAGIDNQVADEEVKAFESAIKENLSEAENLMRHHFQFIQSEKKTSFKEGYEKTLKVIEANKAALSRLHVRKFLYVLEKVAEIAGISEEERGLIDRFEIDMLSIHASKASEKALKMSPEIANLYSTIGQLAYVIAIADHVLMEEEKKVFKEVVKENLGEFDWVAEDRFQAINDVMIKDVESTYDHAMYLIRKNMQALTEEMIVKFVNVIYKIAEVAGITPEERNLINRFQRDIQLIHNEKKNQ